MGIVGWKNSGKTTILTRLVAHFTGLGLTVSTIKHAHHDVDLDLPGKDSFQHRVAGAKEVLLAGGQRWALLHELRDAPEPSLTDLLARMAPVDLVLVEGFKHFPHPKLEVHRAIRATPLLASSDPSVRGIATDEPLATDLPQFALDDTAAIAGFVAAQAQPG